MPQLKPEPLRFPRGVRFPRKNEIPNGNDELFDRIASSNITTGYVHNTDGGEGYSSYFDVNVHADEVFDVFTKLAKSLMPDVAAPLIGLKDEEPVFGPYTLAAAAVGILEPHRELLEHDGFLEFGIVFQHKSRVEEVFVKASKYFQVWTNEPEAAVRIFCKAGIPELPNLEFIDEYPMVSKSIDGKGNAAWPGVFESVKSAFLTLPVAVPDQ